MRERQSVVAAILPVSASRNTPEELYRATIYFFDLAANLH